RDVTVPAFFGRQGEDGKKWLEMFIRFAACHGWTPAYKLIFVIYYLHDNAAVWFENQNFDSWDAFTREFLAVYGNDFLRARRAEEELRTRAQQSGESCHDYVQIILKLCREYNPLMSESEKIAHILKGIAEHVFYLLFQKDFTSVDEILTFCREMDQKFSRRINNSVLFPRLPNTSSKGISPDPDKILAVQNFPEPKSVSEVQNSLGLCSYFRRFIKDFSRRSCLMRSLLR